MKRTASRRRPGIVLSRTWENLRLACEAAKSPLRDRDGLDLLDEHVTAAIEAARSGLTLDEGARALQFAVTAGTVPLGTRTGVGAATFSELLVLASVLRSPVANEVAS